MKSAFTIDIYAHCIMYLGENTDSTHLSTSGWMSGTCGTNNEITFSLKSQGNLDCLYKEDKLERQYAMWNKLGSERQILNGPT